MGVHRVVGLGKEILDRAGGAAIDVGAASDIDEDEISQQGEADLASYYGLVYSKQRSPSGLTEGGQRPTKSGKNRESVTRSEEELEVGPRPVEAGTARLRKWVETEPVASTWSCAATWRGSPASSSTSRWASTSSARRKSRYLLRREKPVVQKQAVAKEHVGLEKDVQTEKQTVRDEVRKERVEVEGDVDEQRR